MCRSKKCCIDYVLLILNIKIENITNPITAVAVKFRPEFSPDSESSIPFISKTILAEILTLPILSTSKLASYFDAVSVSSP